MVQGLPPAYTKQFSQAEQDAQSKALELAKQLAAVAGTEVDLVELKQGASTVVLTPASKLAAAQKIIADKVDAAFVGLAHDAAPALKVSQYFAADHSAVLALTEAKACACPCEKTPKTQEPCVNVDGQKVCIAYQQQYAAKTNYILALASLVKQNKLTVAQQDMCVSTAQQDGKTISIVCHCFEFIGATPAQLADFVRQFSLIHVVPQSALLTPVFLAGEMSADSYAYASAVTRFVYYFVNRTSVEYQEIAKTLADDYQNLGRLRVLQRRELANHQRIHQALLAVPELLVKLTADFLQNIRTPHIGSRKVNEALKAEIATKAQSLVDAGVLDTCALFNSIVLKTNFDKNDKLAISFRVDPSFLAAPNFDVPATPFGLFVLVGAEFQGFHIRFRDIARGGVRMIANPTPQIYNSNLLTQFMENFGLAYTQNLKNKDIPEFGSKGTILLNPGHSEIKVPFKKYVGALLDVIGEKPAAGVLDNYGKPEILFLGPDEYTADMMEYACLYAKSRGYTYWRAFTTGKPPFLGGIPHDKYGMTTRSTHAMVLGGLAQLGLDEKNCTKLQTGGPRGDLGCNEILLSCDKIVGMNDSSATVCDPDGLDRVEMKRLADLRLQTKDFNRAKLGPKGFLVLVSDKNVKLPSGEVVADGVKFRDEFHFHPSADADIFVPCGGRPEAVNLANLSRMYKADGKTPRFKVIVEGANLFITNEARLKLEESGVILFRDASANKGGVSSSSCEVTAALALDEATFEANMAVHDEAKTPAFYKKYVQYIIERVTKDAELECAMIIKEHKRTGIPQCTLTTLLSNKINEVNINSQNSDFFQNVKIRAAVLKDVLSADLIALGGGIEKVMQRVPVAYQQAIFGAYLGSRFVYRFGLNGSDLSFCEFMMPYVIAAQ